MCKKCSFDIGSGYKNNCKCTCDQLTYLETTEEGDVYYCEKCKHIIDGFAKPNEDYENERYVNITKLQWIRKEVV